MDVQAIFGQFSQKRILVIGDVMIDAYLMGKVSRVSPEAPVPIINLSKSEERLGGAANVALNLQALGATPVLCSVIGDDNGGAMFLDLLSRDGLSNEGIIQNRERKTTKKTRVIGNHQHLLRIDEEEVTPLSREQEDLLIHKVSTLIDSVDAVILEDYNKGVLTERVIREVIRIANENDVITTVDPKKENFFAFQNVTLFKPNLKELKEGLHVDFDLETQRDAFEAAVEQLESRMNNAISFITLSEHGVFIKAKGEKSYIPAHIRNISDVSGAGDTVISVATLCLTVGLEPKEVAEIANLSGGLVCEISGVVPVNKEQLMKEVLKLVEA